MKSPSHNFEIQINNSFKEKQIDLGTLRTIKSQERKLYGREDTNSLEGQDFSKTLIVSKLTNKNDEIINVED